MSQLLLYTMAAEGILAALLFALGETVSGYWLPAGCLLGAGTTAFFYGRKPGLAFVVECVAALLVGVLCTYAAGQLYDFSIDGNHYHKLAVGLLRDHWNPLQIQPQTLLPEIPTDHAALWVEAYCKLTWIWGASLYALTGQMETGKMYTLLGMMAVMGLTFYFLKTLGRDSFFCMIFSLAAASNPIAFAQFDTFYVDGFLQLVLYMLVLSLLMALREDLFNPRVSASLVAASMIVCGNIKFSGLLYGGLFCIAFFLLKSGITYGKDADWWKHRIRSGLLFLALAVVTIFGVGNSSYGTNLVRHHTLTYPLTGAHAVDIIKYNTPFSSENHFRNVLVSLYSYMDNFQYNLPRDGRPKSAELKIPFTFHFSREFPMLLAPDARLSGFGPFFSGIWTCCLLVILGALLRMPRGRKKALLLTMTGVCLGLTFGIRESWWARYAPYLYFLALMGLYILLGAGRRLLRYAGTILAALLLVNNALFLLGVPPKLAYSRHLDQTFAEMAQQPVLLFNGTFLGPLYNLKDKGVVYTLDPELLHDPAAQKVGYMDMLWKEEQEVDAGRGERAE